MPTTATWSSRVTAILELEQLAVPYGMNADTWQVLVADATELRHLIEAEAAMVGPTTSGRFGEDLEDGGEDGGERDVDDERDDADEDEDDGDAVVLYGDDAIMAIAARLRDRLEAAVV